MKKTLHLLLFILVFIGASALETGKIYTISHGGKSAFVKNAEPKSGSNVVMWTETEVPSQRWRLELFDDDTYGFVNLYTGNYLGINGLISGALANQREYSKMSTRWLLEEVEGGYRIVSAQKPDFCLAVESADDGADIIFRDMAAAEPETTVFTIADAGDNVPGSFNADVRDAIMDGFLGQYYHDANVGHVLGGGGWWGDAEMFETILDAFATTGDLRYKEIFHELYLNFLQRNGTDWSGNEYNDDITWMVLACIRAYKYFGYPDYLTKAKDNYTRMYSRAKQRFGTLIWKQSQENKLSTNSCINCPATVAACYLGELTGDKTWYDKALTIYEGQRKLLFNASTGEVWDCRAWNPDGTMESGGNRWVSTYNQGTMLGAACALYEYTKDEMYIEDAKKIYERSRDHLTNSNKIISVCQTINGDLCGFKGILMRYVRRYAEMQHLEEPMLWLEKNAWHAYQNRTSKGVIWSAWLTKTDESLKRMEGDSQKDVNNDAFGSSTAVSVAFNAHVNRQFCKSAASGLEARYFDELQFTQLDDVLADGDTPNTTPTALSNGHVCFRNVDFGEEGLNKAIVRINATSGRSFVKVYIDSISESTLLGRTPGFLTKEWQDAEIELDRAVVGIHDVYVQLSGTGVQFHNARFVADEAGVEGVAAGAKSAMSIAGRVLAVNCDEASTLSIYNEAGALEAIMSLPEGLTTLALEPGVHICSLVSAKHKSSLKAIIK